MLKLVEEPKWFAVHTGPRKEGLVNKLLMQQGFETLYLHFVATTKHARRTTTVEKSLFPRYVFATLVNGLSVPQINRTIGVSTVVYQGDKPLDIPAPVIEELRQRGDAKGLVRLPAQEIGDHRRRFRRGEQVRIMGGPMAGLFAIIELDSGRAVRVWVEMFGGKVEAHFDPEGLKSASPEWGTIRTPRCRSRRFT